MRINSLLFNKQRIFRWESQFRKQGEINLKMVLEQLRTIKECLFIKRHGWC